MNNLKTKLEDIGWIALAVVFVIAVVGGLVIYNRWAYHDGSCVIKHCVQVKK